MQKKILINLIFTSVCGIVLATVVLFTIQTIMARTTANKTFALHFDNVMERMQQNELQIDELIQTTKEDYISRARALAMMIELEPGIIKDRGKLNEAAAALSVDEIHIIDENGILWWGTQPKYYGIDFASTDQTRPFLDILDNPELEIAQDAMPNGSEGLMRQYAGVSLRNAKGIAEIGMVPERLEAALKNNQICNVLNGIIVGNTGYIFAISSETGLISTHPNTKLVGQLLPEPLQDSGYMTIDGSKIKYDTRKAGDHILVAALPVLELYSQRTFYTIIFMGFMVLVFGAFCVIVNSYVKRKIVNGILSTVNTLDSISAGNLDVTANMRISREFEKLSDGINHMLLSIKTKMRENANMADDIRRFGAIVAIADAGIIVKDADGIVLEWNIGAETILGYKPEEIIGKTTKAYAPEKSHAGIDEIEERLKKGEHIAHLEVVRKHKAGHLIDCSASYTPIFDEQRVFTGSVAIFHDISDKKQIEQELHDAVIAAKHANTAKSSFLANMSHEIRTPLNGIIGFAELATDNSEIPERTREYLEKIKLSGDGLLQIINDILDISKIEAGKVDLEEIPFSVHKVLDHCKAISSPKADEKGVVLYFCTEPLIQRKLLGDPTKLRQILLNLLSNAIKFTNKGVVKLVMIVEETDENKITIHFEVQDNGIGMTTEQVKKVFKPFTQADSSMTRKYGGSGLGLAISKSMIELMGGELKVESTPDVGSKFGFTLTFKTQEFPDNATDYEEKQKACLKKPYFAGDILVCEDNQINQQVIQGHLLKLGLEATIVENGELGVKAVADKTGRAFDLILMDIHMPVMDGLEASKKLREMGIMTPIVALTANAMTSDKEMYLQSGMSDYLAKPFMARDLWECLLKFLTPVEMVDIEPSDTRETDASSVIDRQSGIEQCGDDEELYDQLLMRFYRNNKYILADIKDAASIGDTMLAHRLAHTLKGVAGTIGASGLKDATLKVEKSLLEMTIVPDEMQELESRLNDVMAVLEVMDKDALEREQHKIDYGGNDFVEDQNSNQKSQTNEFDKADAMKLIDKLIPLLEDCNMSSLEMLPVIRNELSPIGEIANFMIEQIDDCDFTLAAETAGLIRQMLINNQGLLNE